MLLVEGGGSRQDTTALPPPMWAAPSLACFLSPIHHVWPCLSLAPHPGLCGQKSQPPLPARAARPGAKGRRYPGSFRGAWTASKMGMQGRARETLRLLISGQQCPRGCPLPEQLARLARQGTRTFQEPGHGVGPSVGPGKAGQPRPPSFPL